MLATPTHIINGNLVALTPGVRLGPYEIVSALGAGGMGEVYKARDPRLGRDVAIKVLPAEFSADSDRLRRFEQEARAIAALNHPHICQIHDVGPGYLVLEYIDGAPLRGPLAPTEAVRLILQVADALDVRRWAASLLIHSGPSRRSEARRDRVATNGEVALVVRDDGTYQPYFAPQR